jgi:hypothetical protein
MVGLSGAAGVLGRSGCDIPPQMCRTFWVIREMLEIYGLAGDHIPAIRARYTVHLEAMILDMRLGTSYPTMTSVDFHEFEPTPPGNAYIPWANWLIVPDDERVRFSNNDLEVESLAPLPQCRVIIRNGDASVVNFDLTPMNLSEIRTRIGATVAGGTSADTASTVAGGEAIPAATSGWPVNTTSYGWGDSSSRTEGWGWGFAAANDEPLWTGTEDNDNVDTQLYHRLRDAVCSPTFLQNCITVFILS